METPLRKQLLGFEDVGDHVDLDSPLLLEGARLNDI